MRRSTPKTTWLPLAVLLSFAVALGCQWSGGRRFAPATAPCPAPEEGLQDAPECIDATNSAGTVPAACAPCYEEALSGGRVFTMYCGACHNARALGERPFASYESAANHMRVRANLTGEEYRKLMVFLRYWHDIPPQTPPVEPSPKRFIFSQPLSELRPVPAAAANEALPAQTMPENIK